MLLAVALLTGAVLLAVELVEFHPLDPPVVDPVPVTPVLLLDALQAATVLQLPANSEKPGSEGPQPVHWQ